MNGYIVKYDQDVQIPEGGCITQRKVKLFTARDYTHAQGMASTMCGEEGKNKEIKQVY